MENVQQQAKESAKGFLMAKLPWWIRWLISHPSVGYPIGILLGLLVVFIIFRFGRRLWKTLKLVVVVSMLASHAASLSRLFFSHEKITLRQVWDALTGPERALLNTLLAPLYAFLAAVRPMVKILWWEFKQLLFVGKIALREVVFGYLTLVIVLFFAFEERNVAARLKNTIPQLELFQDTLIHLVASAVGAVIAVALRGPIVVLFVLYLVLKTWRQIVQFFRPKKAK
jgi:hypothetical protein